MNKLLTFAVLLGGLSSAHAASIMDAPAPAQQTAPAAQAPAEPESIYVISRLEEGELDRIVAVVNQDVITERELQNRTHVVAINLRRQNISLPPMETLRAQVLDRLITERAIMQRAKETGIRIDDQMVNASIEQIARQNNLTVDELNQRLAADGVSFAAFREEIRDEITTQRLREREVDEKIVILDSEIDTYLAEQAGFTNADTTEYRLAHILLPLEPGADETQLLETGMLLAQRARNGEDFSALAASHSRSPDALEGGDLGWRDRSRIPSEFWDAISKDPKTGNVFVTQSKTAVHVIKVLDQRDGVEAKLSGGPVVQTHVRHILMFVSDITPEADVLRRLNEIKARIDAGEADFATMARLNSVDNSATRGGDLGWIQAGDTVPEFEAAMNALQPGQVSEPIKSQYGYHLIQVIERRTDKEGNPQRMRIAARQALREKKLAEAVYNWQRELRDQAYVEIRGENLD